MKRLFIAALATVLTVHSVGFGLLALPERANASGLGDPPPVVINEVMWMGTYQGATARNADEWIELRNTTNSPIDISGWQLTNVGLPVFPASSVVPANGYFLVANYTMDDPSSVLNVAPDWVENDISIGNTCTPIELKNTAVEIIDTMGCDGTAYFGGLNDTGNEVRKSLERAFVIGDGTLALSWQTSVGFVGLDADAKDLVKVYTYATPKAPNDLTAPLVSVINDGASADIDKQSNTTALTANWQPFTELESEIVSYEVGYGTSVDGSDVVAWVSAYSHSYHQFLGLSLLPGNKYYVSVRATNLVNLVSEIATSDGVTIVDAKPTSLLLSDTPSDNGGSLNAQWQSEAEDLKHYLLCLKKVTDGDCIDSEKENIGVATSITRTGLENGIEYRFKVFFVDVYDVVSESSWSDKVAPVDNLAPVLDSTKLLLSQNAPGTQDAFSGLAGAVNEKSTISLYKSSVISSDNLISSVESSVDGSIAGTLLGDNMFGEIWVVAKDAANNSSAAIKLTNDIVAPNAPTLTALSSNCNTSTCRVTLAWSDNGPDTTGYRVQYTVDGALTTVANLSSTELLLDLPEGKNYEFAVIAYDAAGNLSALSNKILVGLNRGVNVNATFVNGSLVIDTSAIEESIVPIPATGGLGDVIVPSARASDFALPEDVSTEVAGVQDWGRVFTVVFLMLIVASGFYALSRQIKDTPQLDAATPKEVKRSKSPPPKAPTAPKSAGRASPKRRPRRKR